MLCLCPQYATVVFLSCRAATTRLLPPSPHRSLPLCSTLSAHPSLFVRRPQLQPALRSRSPKQHTLARCRVRHAVQGCLAA